MGTAPTTRTNKTLLWPKLFDGRLDVPPYFPSFSGDGVGCGPAGNDVDGNGYSADIYTHEHVRLGTGMGYLGNSAGNGFSDA